MWMTDKEVKAHCDDQVTASVSALLRAAFRNPPVLADRETFSRRRHYRSRDEVAVARN
jgi:hypothetical protein